MMGAEVVLAVVVEVAALAIHAAAIVTMSSACDTSSSPPQYPQELTPAPLAPR
jgi:hypothetical protein